MFASRLLKSQVEFERLVLPETPRLLRFARRLTGDASAAEDLAQEALLKAWRGFHQFRPGTSARAWVYRIMVNSFYEQGRKPRLELELAPTESRATAVETLEVNQALDALPDEQRTVVLLGIVEGFTCREISEILVVPIGTVMSRLSRARQSLREKLAPERSVASAKG